MLCLYKNQRFLKSTGTSTFCRASCFLGLCIDSSVMRKPLEHSEQKKKKNRIYVYTVCLYDALPASPRLYPCTLLPTAPVSRSFGLRSSYEIDILDTQRLNTGAELFRPLYFKSNFFKHPTLLINPAIDSSAARPQNNLLPDKNLSWYCTCTRAK